MKLRDARARIDRRSPFDRESYGRGVRSGMGTDRADFRFIPQEVETGRIRLAEAMLPVATEGNTNVENLQVTQSKVMFPPVDD